MQLLFFISGIGVLLLAMQQLESALANLGSGQLKTGLHTFTKTPIHGVFLGLTSTAILQSSSIVGLMTMAFVGAGTIKLKNAIGVILGSNLGTTFTGWLVAFLGFKLNLTEFSVPFLGLGAMGMVLFKSGNKNQNISQFIFAFGFLLLGLTLMKDSIIFVVDYVDIAKLEDYPLFLYFLFGAALTALIQSSSATMMITLSALNSGIIEIPIAAAIIIGADLGTTSTVIIGSVKGPIIKRQVALIHFLFNFLVDIGAFIFLPILLMVISKVFVISDPLYGLVAIHSSFNLIGILLFLPFVQKLQVFVEKKVPEPKSYRLLISNVSNEIPAAAVHAVEEDTCNLLKFSILLNAKRLNILEKMPTQELINLSDSNESIYAELKHQENHMSDYILDLQRQALTQEESARAQQLLVCIRDSLYSTKAVKDIFEEVDELVNHPNADIREAFKPLLHNTEKVYRSIVEALNDSSSFSITQLSTYMDLITQAHMECNAQIYELIDNKHLKKESASTALNINREILLAGHSLINALEHYLLPGEQAKTVSELLNMR